MSSLCSVFVVLSHVSIAAVPADTVALFPDTSFNRVAPVPCVAVSDAALLYKLRRKLNPAAQARGALQVPSSSAGGCASGGASGSKPVAMSLDEQIARRDSDEDLATVSFLVSSFKPSCWWAELFNCGYKVLITGCVVFIRPGTATQIVVGLLLSLVALAVQTEARPFIADGDNRVATLASWGVSLGLVAALLQFVESSATADSGPDSVGADRAAENWLFDAALVTFTLTVFALAFVIAVQENLIARYAGIREQHPHAGLDEVWLRFFAIVNDDDDDDDKDDGPDADGNARGDWQPRVPREVLALRLCRSRVAAWCPSCGRSRCRCWCRRGSGRAERAAALTTGGSRKGGTSAPGTSDASSSGANVELSAFKCGQFRGTGPGWHSGSSPDGDVGDGAEAGGTHTRRRENPLFAHKTVS